jgi:hypothetical protein
VTLNDVLDQLNEGADQDLGAVVGVMDGLGKFDQADILENGTLHYVYAEDRIDGGYAVNPVLSVDPLFFRMVTDETVNQAGDALAAMHQDGFLVSTG